jgi:hypothetical protein
MPKKKNEGTPSKGKDGSEERCAKMARLSMVLGKAVDSSVESLGPGDLEDCLGDVFSRVGDGAMNAFRSLLGRTQQLIDTRFHELSEQRDLNGKLSVLEKTKAPVPQKSPTAANKDDILSQMVIDVQNMEAEVLRATIEKMDKDIENLVKKATSLRSQLDDNKAALIQEHSKFKEANEKLV